MPILKSYTDGSGHYIHASVRGAVVTFQTTTRAVEKLGAAGVPVGVRFSLRMLADLTRTGDAYTHRGGVEFYEAEQFEFDFKESQESEGLFPACAVTGGFEDLHLVAYDGDGEQRVELLGPSARAGLSGPVGLSVPISILSRSMLGVLESTGKVPGQSATVLALRRWYEEEASAEWERVRRERQARQAGFDFEAPGELGL